MSGTYLLLKILLQFILAAAHPAEETSTSRAQIPRDRGDLVRLNFKLKVSMGQQIASQGIRLATSTSWLQDSSDSKTLHYNLTTLSFYYVNSENFAMTIL